MGTESLLPWRRDRGPEALNDKEVLEWIDRRGPSSPREISEMRRKESEIRLQCRYLDRSGFLLSIGNESYCLTAEGRSLICGEISPPCSNGYIDVIEFLTFPEPRISRVFALSQLVIKRRNSEFYEAAMKPNSDIDVDYSVDVLDERRKRRVVWSVKKWKLERLLNEFPRFEGVVSQCAHWMRTISGLHLFPDANHRTGMATLWMLVADNDIIDEDHPWPGTVEEIGKAVLLSKFNRYLASKVDFRTLWRKDNLYWHWHQYFDYLLNGAYYPALSKHSERDLRQMLQQIRGRA